MSAWEPKVGDVVAVQATVVERTGEQELDDGGPPIPFFTVRSVATDDEFDAQTPAEIAPWLPAEDHAALMRFLRAARVALDSGHSADCVLQRAHSVVNASPGAPLPCVCGYDKKWRDLRAALAATEHIR